MVFVVLTYAFWAQADIHGDVKDFLAQYPGKTRPTRVEEFRRIVRQQPPELFDTIFTAIRLETSREFGREIGEAIGTLPSLTPSQLSKVTLYLTQAEISPPSLGGLAYGLGQIGARADAGTRETILKALTTAMGRRLPTLAEGAARGLIAMGVSNLDVFHEIVVLLDLNEEGFHAAQTILLKEIRLNARQLLNTIEPLLRRKEHLTPELAIEVLHDLETVNDQWSPRMHTMFHDAFTSPFASITTKAHAAELVGAGLDCGSRISANGSPGD